MLAIIDRVAFLLPFEIARGVIEKLPSWRQDWRRTRSEWLGVEPVDVEIGNVDALAAKYPQVADDLRTFRVPVKK